MLGADFLRLHNLLIDICGKRLIEADTYSSIFCVATHASVHQLATISPVSNQYRKVPLGYQEIIQPTFSSDTVLHGVQHYITTSGIPVHDKARMLALDKLAIAKTEFLEMEKMGIIRKSNSPSPLLLPFQAELCLSSPGEDHNYHPRGLLVLTPHKQLTKITLK